MDVIKNEAWAIIPARGGSKSIPLKNLVSLGGKPLIYYVIAAAKQSRDVKRIICSTDHQQIAAVCDELGVEIHSRPADLSGDDVAVLHVLAHLLRDIGSREGKVADAICLLQPTSPFVLPEHIDRSIKMLEKDDLADSVQTITKFSLNYHAYNQRVIEDGNVRFRFHKERKIFYNKQTKPIHYIFGNLVVTRSRTLLEEDDIFGERSIPLVIPRYYATDIDEPQDLEWAEWLLDAKKVILPHMDLLRVGRAAT